MQVSDIIRIDESARMRKPPENAVFYLAEVHRGASFDLFVDGTRSAMGRRLESLFLQGSGAAKYVQESGSYRLKAFGLGLRDVSGEGIVVIDEPMFALKEGGYQSWTIPSGEYRIESTSEPNGLQMTWSGDVTCNMNIRGRREYRILNTNCAVAGNAQLTLTNPTTLGLGPTETMSLYVARTR